MTKGIAQRTVVDASTSGELVVLSVGGFDATMHFADALSVSAILLTHGREARRNQLGAAAKLLPKIRSMAMLTDADADKEPPNRWNRTLPERYKGSEIMARTSGHQVELRFRSIVMGLPWEAALHISQILRIRGRQAKNSINEKAHWADIAKVPS